VDPAPRPDAHDARERRLARWVLALALAVGAARFWRLGEWSLWIDEAFTLADSLDARERANPLGYWIWRQWIDWSQALGWNAGGRAGEALLRLPAAAFGWLALPLAAWALRPLAGALASAGVALALASSPWQLYWSQTARFYTLAECAALAGLGLALRGILAARLAALVAGAALAAAGALAHPSALVVPAALAAAVVGAALARWPVAPGLARQARWLALAGLAALAAASPWLSVVWSKWNAAKGAGSPLHFLLTTGFYVSPPVGLALVCGGASALASPTQEALRARFLLLAVAAGGLALLAVSLWARVSAQYAFVLHPLILALALAPAAERAWPLAARASWLALVSLPGLAGQALYFGVRNGERPHWREAYEYVAGELRPGDLVLGMEAPVGEYVLDPAATDLRHPTRLEWLDAWRSHLPAETSRGGRRTWFVVQLEQLEDWPAAQAGDARALTEILARDCRRVASWPLFVEARDLSVHVYLRD
jgi:hypothetical protein